MKGTWDTCNTWVQAQIIAYAQIRDYEDQEERMEFHKFLAVALGAKTRIG